MPLWTVSEIADLLESICGKAPEEVRIHSLVPKATRASKFFVKLASIQTAGLLRIELNGRYLKEFKASVSVSFFASNAVKVHLQGIKQPVDSDV